MYQLPIFSAYPDLDGAPAASRQIAVAQANSAAAITTLVTMAMLTA